MERIHEIQRIRPRIYFPLYPAIVSPFHKNPKPLMRQERAHFAVRLTAHSTVLHSRCNSPSFCKAKKIQQLQSLPGITSYQELSPLTFGLRCQFRESQDKNKSETSKLACMYYFMKLSYNQMELTKCGNTKQKIKVQLVGIIMVRCCNVNTKYLYHKSDTHDYTDLVDI